MRYVACATSILMLSVREIQNTCNAGPHLPDAEAEGACLGVGLLGVTDLVTNWAPGTLSKKPAPEEAALEKTGCLGAEGLAGAADRFANCAPTALSKKPFDVRATQLALVTPTF